MRFPGERIRSLAGDIDARRVGVAELSKRIVDLDIAEVRQLGRLLLERARVRETTETNEYLEILRGRCEVHRPTRNTRRFAAR